MAFADDIERADRAVQVHLGSVPVTYQPMSGDASGQEVVVQGMFDANYVLIEQGQAGVEQTTPAVWLMLDDLPGDPAEDDATVVVGGVSYEVYERRPDSVVGDSIMLMLHVAR